MITSLALSARAWPPYRTCHQRPTSPDAASLISAGYAMFFGGLLMLGARLGDRLGHRRTILTGLGIFAVAASGWWPPASTTASVALTTTTGEAWCGPLVSGPDGAVSVRTATGVVRVPIQIIARVRPVGQC